MQTESIRPSGTAQAAYAPVKNKKTAAGRRIKHTPGVADAGVCVDMDVENGHNPEGETRSQSAPLPARSLIDTEALAAVVRTFADAYNALLDALLLTLAQTGENDTFANTAEALRAAVYQPVSLRENTARRVSLYEVGVAHSPNESCRRNDQQTTGRLTVNKKKLLHAVKERETDVQTLFAGTDENLPMRLRALLTSFITQSGSEIIRPQCEAFLASCDSLRSFFIFTE